MLRITTSELRNRLSAYLKRARAGETVLILDRDTPVAQLIPVVAEAQDRLTRLEREGLLRCGTAAVPLDLVRSEPPASGESVLEALLEERRQTR